MPFTRTMSSKPLKSQKKSRRNTGGMFSFKSNKVASKYNDDKYNEDQDIELSELKKLRHDKLESKQKLIIKGKRRKTSQRKNAKLNKIYSMINNPTPLSETRRKRNKKYKKYNLEHIVEEEDESSTPSSSSNKT
jgi:hypothetical protein